MGSGLSMIKKQWKFLWRPVLFRFLQCFQCSLNSPIIFLGILGPGYFYFMTFFLSDSEIPWCFWKGPLRLSTSNSSATSGECSTRPDWQKSHPTWSWTHRITGVVMHLWRSSRPAPWNTSREGLWHGMFASVSALRFVKYLNGLSIWLEGTLKSLSPSYSSYFWITPRMRTPS